MNKSTELNKRPMFFGRSFEMITRAALIHIPKSNLCYAYDRKTLHIRVKALRGEIEKAYCRIGDPFDWERGGGGGNLEASGASGWHHRLIEMKLEATTEYHDVFFASIERPTKRSRYAFLLEGHEETILFGERRMLTLDGSPAADAQLNDLGNYFCFPYISEDDVLTVPAWSKNTVWYHIFPDRFCNGEPSNDPENTEPWGTEPTRDNYMGGDLQGVTRKLDYLSELGVTGLHFCPIFKGLKNHRYETLDYFQIDSIFGGDSAFKTLVEKAHARGIRIMLDGVFNHMAAAHPFFQDVLSRGKASPYFDWFHIDQMPIKPGTYETFAYSASMPKINFECQAAFDYFIGVGVYWVKTYGIDGWRLDVGNEVSHDFWRAFRKAVRKENPEVLILGEIWHDALPWLRGDQYDAVMNYPLMEACARFFAYEAITAETFKRKVDTYLTNYPKGAVEAGYNLLDSHDTSRFLSIAHGDSSRLILAYVFLYAFPGSPAIFYGDEVGISGEKSDESERHRRCMIWDESKWSRKIYETLKRMGTLRADDPDFRGTEFEWMDFAGDDGLAFRKGALLFLINRGHENRVFEAPKTEVAEQAEQRFEDQFTGETVSGLGIEVLPESFRILRYMG